MGVYIKDEKFRWLKNSVIGYEADVDAVAEMLKEFNRLVGVPIFVREREANKDPDRMKANPNLGYVRISLKSDGHSNCAIGKKGGMQSLVAKPDRTTLFHELCHCIGLGHENYHSKWPYREQALKNTRNLQCLALSLNPDKYASHGEFDAKSIMLYSPQSFGFEDPTFQQNTELSDGDIALVRFLMRR